MWGDEKTTTTRDIRGIVELVLDERDAKRKADEIKPSLTAIRDAVQSLKQDTAHELQDLRQIVNRMLPRLDEMERSLRESPQGAWQQTAHAAGQLLNYYQGIANAVGQLTHRMAQCEAKVGYAALQVAQVSDTKALPGVPVHPQDVQDLLLQPETEQAEREASKS